MADLKTGADAPDLPETLRLKIVYRPIDDLAARELARRGQDWSPRRLDYAIWVRERNQRP